MYTKPLEAGVVKADLMKSCGKKKAATLIIGALPQEDRDLLDYILCMVELGTRQVNGAEVTANSLVTSVHGAFFGPGPKREKTNKTFMEVAASTGRRLRRKLSGSNSFKGDASVHEIGIKNDLSTLLCEYYPALF